MTPEPPLDMFPNRPDVWYAGVDACQRGLPITFDHPYCCTLKDVWEAGWKAAAGDVNTPIEYAKLTITRLRVEIAHLQNALQAKEMHPIEQSDSNAFKKGVVDAKAGRSVDHNPFLVGDNLRNAWEKGWLSVASPTAPTTQQLIDAWVAARDALESHVRAALPFGCDVVVDNPTYQGHGIVRGYPLLEIDQVYVGLPNQPAHSYPVTSVRRVE